ncbi:hypothetical protein AB6A40_000626 [Gnathostoma spinigerum]|uniref:Major facilitator superfamily (MFS) profile domain-containing protein n=1 Tax=Gnathostoma spinigerum TaxID=75299 RepID=A0ABD6E4I7_9BILA
MRHHSHSTEIWHPYHRVEPVEMYVRLFVIASITSILANWQFGYQITYVNTSVDTFYIFLNSTYCAGTTSNNCSFPSSEWTTHWSILTASFYLGAAVGIVLVPAVINYFGVRQTLILACIPSIIGGILQVITGLLTTTGYTIITTLISVGRILLGLHAGSTLCLLPLFITEISPLKDRGFLNTLQQFSQSLSTLSGFVIGSENIIYFGAGRFEWLQMISLIPAVVFFFILLILPETPKRCLKHFADDEQKMKSVRFYHGHSSVERAIDELNDEEHNNICCDRRIQWKSTTIKGLLLGSTAAMSYAFTGDDIIDTFSSQLIQSYSPHENAIGTDMTADLITVFLGIILVVASLIGSLLIHKFGNRRLLIFGLIGTAISNSLVTLFSWQTSAVPIILSFVLTKCFIGLGAGAPAWFLTSELVPPQMTFICQSISTGLLLLMNGIVTFVFLPLKSALSWFSILMLTTGPALLSAVLLYLFLPETKNKCYSQVRDNLSQSVFSGITLKHGFDRLKSYGTINE